MNRSILEFPNLSVSASYSPMSQTMNFNHLSKRQFDGVVAQLASRRFEIETVETAGIIVHEAAHYFDHLGTLSGQVLLAKVYNALNEVTSRPGQAEAIIDLFNTLQSWGHKHYTTARVGGICDPDPANWSYNFNMGFGRDVFGETVLDRFLFAIFKYCGIRIGNVPFSIESLWETNAMWAEITYNLYVASALEDEHVRTVEYNRINRKYRAYLYDSDKLVYALAAHFTSSLCNLGDIVRAFKLSKALAGISLNLPYAYYEQLKQPRGTVFREYGHVLLKEAKSLNPCAVYLVLLENLIEAELDAFAEGLNVNCNAILACSGLPTQDILKQDILREMERLDIADRQAEFAPHYAVQKANGIHLFEVYGMEGGLLVHPACFIDLAHKSNSTLFQVIHDDELEAALSEETDAQSRHYAFRGLEQHMIRILQNVRMSQEACT